MNGIPASELILNPDGSIYHLNLTPDDLAGTVITVGDPGRVERVSRHFDRVEVRKSKREFITHTGYLNEKRLTVISTGIGPDNIDIVLNELDALVNVDFTTRRIREEKQALNIIRVGTSGSLHPDLPVDSLVAARYGLGLDNLMNFYELPQNLATATLFDELRAFLESTGLLPVIPYVVDGSLELLQALAPDMVHGITVTAPGFYGPQGRRLRLAPRLSSFHLEALARFAFRDMRVTNFEMETSAIYGLAKLLGHRALSCNVLIANRATGAFTADPKAAEEKVITHVLQRIADIPG